jgi:predicted tellurium resistance membrane protein TerC
MAGFIFALIVAASSFGSYSSSEHCQADIHSKALLQKTSHNEAVFLETVTNVTAARSQVISVSLSGDAVRNTTFFSHHIPYASLLASRIAWKNGVLSLLSYAFIDQTEPYLARNHIPPKVFHWCMFIVAASLAFLMRRRLPAIEFQRRKDNVGLLKATRTIMSLGAWILLGFLYAFILSRCIGMRDSVDWLAGYTLELVFLIDNILIFQVIVQAFKLSSALTARALDIVVWGQVLFEAVFFMSLSTWLRTCWWLPYILGVWMLYFGVATIFEPVEEEHEFDDASPRKHSEVHTTHSNLCEEKGFAAGLRRWFGDFQLHKEATSVVVLEKGRVFLSVLGVTACALLVTDFMIEIDAVLTKIEEFRNPYVAFSSSALASFAIPELFSLNQDLINCFPLLKVGVGIILCFLGLEMFLAKFWVMPPAVALCVILIIFATSMTLSTVQKHFSQDLSEKTNKKEITN